MIARWLTLAVLASGCSMSSMSTVPHTRVGYATPTRVALRISGEGPTADQWRFALRGNPLVSVVDDIGDVKVRDPGSEHARMCQLGRSLVQAGKPVDLVIEIDTGAGASEETKCTNYKHSLDHLFEKNDSEPECEEYSYDHTTASASSTVRVIDVATCAPIRTSKLASAPVSEDGHGKEQDRAIALQRVTMEHIAAIQPFMAKAIVPRGVQIAHVEGRRVEVVHQPADQLAVGDVYVVRAASGDSQESDRVRVASIEGDRATLEIEHEHVGLGIGEELRARKRGYIWTLYPSLATGVLRTDAGNAVVGGLSVALRLSMQDLPLFVETDLSGMLIPKFGSTQLGFSILGGLHYPIGPLVPVAFAELGLATAKQLEMGPEERVGHKTWSFAGVGGGLELWLGRYFVFGDLRYRTAISSAEDWKLDDGKTVIFVAHEFVEQSSVLARATAGFVF